MHDKTLACQGKWAEGGGMRRVRGNLGSGFRARNTPLSVARIAELASSDQLHISHVFARRNAPPQRPNTSVICQLRRQHARQH
jgi:hypothetical protein